MIVEYIRYTIAEDARVAFVDAYDRAARALAASPHCLAYELSSCDEEPSQYVLRIDSNGDIYAEGVDELLYGRLSNVL